MSGDTWKIIIKSLVFRSNKEWRDGMECLKRLKNTESQYYKDCARYQALLFEIAELVNNEFEKE